MLKIAHIALKGLPLGGGIEKYVEEVGARLVKKGYEIVVYTTRSYGNDKQTYYKGMKIIPLRTIKSKKFEKLTASFYATLLNTIKEKDTDIVHFHAFGPSMFCFIPRILGKKVVVQGHGIEWKRAKWGALEKLLLRLLEIPSVLFPHVVTVVSKTQQKYLQDKYGIKSVYIPPGVNPPKIEEPELIRKKYGLEKNGYILFAARLVKEKGAHYLIEAYNKIKTNKKLVIAGDALYEDEYKSYLKDLASKSRDIIFTGFVTGKLLRELFSNCYVFVLPSELEGLPIALLEAMSYGNCCLVSDIPENIEALGNFGFSFKNKDINKLAEKLNFLIKNEKVVYEMRKKAKEYVLKNFLWDNITLKFEELYNRLKENKLFYD